MRTYNIISKDSLIFDFAETGDIDGLKYLLDHNQGSVFDCDVKGYNALIVSDYNTSSCGIYEQLALMPMELYR